MVGMEVTAMNTNAKTHLIEIPIGGNGGEVWNNLHSEREDICEAILRDCKVSGVHGEADAPRDAATTNWQRELLQARLRQIDDALDRLMSGSYGHCSKCGEWIGDNKLEFDPAIAFCSDCLNPVHNETRPLNQIEAASHMDDCDARVASSQSELPLEELQPFDTIFVRTLNSDYRILLLDPKTHRVLVEGGQYLMEPREAFLCGSTLNEQFKFGRIAVGYHLEMWVDKRIVCTSRVESASLEHRESAESPEAITALIQ
jgi:RNA polymerase-binding transcription factor DksA